jgi:transposase
MPYKTDKLAYNCPFLDNRSKLLPCQKEMVVWYKENEGMSQRKLAAKFNVSRRTIQFILDPEKLSKNKQRRAERGGSKAYYDKEKHKQSMKKHRRLKYTTLNEIV